MLFSLIFLSGLCHSEEAQPSKSWFDSAVKSASKMGTEAWSASADTRSKAWDATKKLSSEAVDRTIKLSSEAWSATADTRSKAWDKSKVLVSETWDSTALKTEQFYKAHETKIKIAGGVIAAGAAIYAGSQLTPSSSPEAIPSLQGPYSNIPDTGVVKAGGFFSDAAKRQILNENIARNGGVLKSDLSGTVLTLPGRYTKGYSPSPTEAQIDHVFPRSQGGTNNFGNAQVLSREENLLKGAIVPK